MRISLNKKIIFVEILVIAAFFRFYGINWDQNQHLHPDERFLTMVSTAIQWPASPDEYFDASTSPLNPHNKDFPFFVYGTFPIFFTKYIAELFSLGDYNNLTLIGRQLSALIDLGTVILVFFIGKLFNWKIGLFATFFYSASVLPIQLSHFYAVDTYLTFFITLTFFLCVKLQFQISKIKYQKFKLNIKYILLIILIGISFGLSLASKISAILFLPIILLSFFLNSLLKFQESNKSKIFYFLYVFLIFNILFFILSYFTLRFSQPYLFASPNLFDITPNPKVLENWKTLKSFEDPSGWFPPSVQWITTKSYIFPLKNLIFWGLGLPAGIIALLALLYSFKRMIHHKILFLAILWVFILFVYQGYQFAKPMRYFYPLYPFLAILCGYFINKVLLFIRERYQILKIKDQKYILNIKNLKIFNFLYVFLLFTILFLILVYPLSFISIYSHPHSRVQASIWIYENIPPGSVIANEYWDDALPLYLAGYDKNYEGISLPLYDADTEEKWTKLSKELERIDYIVLSSNRLYGSIMTVPEKYPLTTKYYESLFDGSLGFEKVAEFTSRSNLPLPFINLCLTPPFTRYGIIAFKNQQCPLPGISFVDDYADESFTVYDHPKVIIFKK